jgi:hypothetical protein
MLWLAVISFGLAFVLLVVTNLGLWVTLCFPAWALAVSTFLLVRHPARTERQLRVCDVCPWPSNARST